ncbi:Cytochrome P450 71D8 [Senna tora]|uniref:Cytochrome P450 71D8 n=1 Tax=Senna tora TaxID=362788 RepID=A0A834THF7_9FABA|nr:Cytochrome P450 71D8 [Senna tora]
MVGHTVFAGRRVSCIRAHRVHKTPVVAGRRSIISLPSFIFHQFSSHNQSDGPQAYNFRQLVFLFLFTCAWAVKNCSAAEAILLQKHSAECNAFSVAAECRNAFFLQNRNAEMHLFDGCTAGRGSSIGFGQTKYYAEMHSAAELQNAFYRQKCILQQNAFYRQKCILQQNADAFFPLKTSLISACAFSLTLGFLINSDMVHSITDPDISPSTNHVLYECWKYLQSNIITRTI